MKKILRLSVKFFIYRNEHSTPNNNNNLIRQMLAIKCISPSTNIVVTIYTIFPSIEKEWSRLEEWTSNNNTTNWTNGVVEDRGSSSGTDKAISVNWNAVCAQSTLHLLNSISPSRFPPPSLPPVWGTTSHCLREGWLGEGRPRAKIN